MALATSEFENFFWTKNLRIRIETECDQNKKQIVGNQLKSNKFRGAGCSSNEIFIEKFTKNLREGRRESDK